MDNQGHGREHRPKEPDRPRPRPNTANGASRDWQGIESSEIPGGTPAEGLWYSLVANAPIFIAVVDRAGTIQFLNRTQPGYSIEQSLGKRIYDFVDARYHDIAKAALEKVFRTGDNVSYETVAAGPDGCQVWYETHLGPVRHGDEIVGAALFSTDISARKRAEQQLQQARDTLERRVEERTTEVRNANEQLRQEIESRIASEERYRLLVETTNDLIWELDRRGAYTYVSPTAKSLLGYEAEEMIGRTPFDFMPPEEADRLRTLYEERIVSGERILRLELVRFHKNGQLLVHETNVSPYFDDSGQCCGFRGISRDVTQRRHIEESLCQNHEELQAIYDGMVDGLLIADVETKSFVRANHAICKMLGYTEEEILSRSVMDIHPPGDVPEVLANFQAQAEGRLVVAENLPVLRKDGTVFYADITTNQLVYQGRDCNIGFFRDISERKHSEESLRKEHQVLKQLLEAQDRERQIIAYEIHDGLTQHLVAATMQFQTFVRMQGIPDETSAACTAVHRLLEQALAEARNLINGVRPPILDEFGVVAAVQHLVHAKADQSKTRIDLRCEVTFDRLDPVLENAIYRIVQETLSNVCRHSKSDVARIELMQHDEYVRICVQDWGIGFDPQCVDDRCFGLAGIRERARLLGGSVQVNSQRGSGSQIIVELPLKVAEADN